MADTGETPPPVPPPGSPPPGAPGAQFPPPGSYPPPPGPSGSYPPPPGQYPPGQYGPGQYPPGESVPTGRADVGEALKWSWQVFSRRPGPMVVPGLVTLVVAAVGAALVVAGVFWMVPSAVEVGGTTTSTSDFNIGGFILVVLVSLLMVFALIYLQGAITSGVIRVADGQSVSYRDFLVPTRTAAFIGTVILVALIIVLGLILLIIPGLVAIFALQYAPVYVLDQKMSPTQAIAASARLAFAKPLDSLLVLVVHYIYGYIGGLAFGLGAIVTLPMGEAFLVRCYRDLVGRPIPPGVA